MKSHPLSLAPFALLFCTAMLSPLQAAASGPSRFHTADRTESTLTNDFYATFLVNNVFNYYGNNGAGCYNQSRSDESGFEIPKENGTTTAFREGILWAGFHKGRTLPKAGGSEFRFGLQAGKILTAGTPATVPVADDPSLPRYRVFRVRPDVNPSTPLDTAMRARLDSEEVAYISRYESVTAGGLYAQYLSDWNEWPAADGAPYDDVNGNGQYDPGVDIPGVPGADQTLWYVANDLDSLRVYRLAGSVPIGLEMQKTIWGYRTLGPVRNAIFMRTRLINKSGAPVDSMYVGQFADPDLTSGPRDCIGADTLRDLGYDYIGLSGSFPYAPAPVAEGFLLLQGPAVPGHGNLRMHALNVWTNGWTRFLDPYQGPGGDLERYRLLKGRTRRDSAWVNPLTGDTTTIVFPGDPVTGTGWLQGLPLIPPTDVRLLLSCGPFTFAAGDTQEVVFTQFVASGATNLASVTLLRQYADSLKSRFSAPPPFAAPRFDLTVTYPDASKATLHVSADGRAPRAKSIDGAFLAPDGSLVAAIQLFDDGKHNDGAAGDGLFGGEVTLDRRPAPLQFGATVIDQRNRTYSWSPLIQHITTAGPLDVGMPGIFSDNINNDGKPNPGENVRFGLAVRNSTGFTLSNLLLQVEFSSRRIPSLLPGTLDSTVYNAADPATYLALDVPYNWTAPQYATPLTITDTLGNLWTGRLIFPVYPLPVRPQVERVQHDRGHSTGDFQVWLIDPSQLRNHLYAIYGVDSINASGDHGFTLKDSTDGRILLSRHPLPDPWDHNVVPTDGFKVLRGNIRDQSGRVDRVRTSTDTLGDNLLYLYGSGTNSLGLEYNRSYGNAFEHWPSGGVGYNQQHTVKLRFAGLDTAGHVMNPADTNMSFAYRYLEHADAPPARPEFAPFIKNPSGGFAYQDYTRTLPFTAYDIDVDPPLRLMVGYLENNVPLGLVDGRYWPPRYSADNGIDTGPREWFFIFAEPYNETPDPALQVDIGTSHVPLMWIGTPGRDPFHSYPSGWELSIFAGHAPGSGDVWTFTPTFVGINQASSSLPGSFQLYQNYPNPFNPSTTIRYALPARAHVTLSLYDILGREVDRLVSDNVEAGYHELRYDAGRLASGVYFYRLTASAPGKNTFIQTRKLLLLR